MTNSSLNTMFRAAEPPVDEMLADPLVHLVMKRDGVSREEILRVLRCVSHARAGHAHLVEPVGRPCS
jgi:hypothetical protein